MKDQRTIHRRLTTMAWGRAVATGIASTTLLCIAAVRLLGRGLPNRSVEETENPERGDVPGWVMVTLMTAALVALLLAVAGPALEGLFKQAIDTVTKK